MEIEKICSKARQLALDGYGDAIEKSFHAAYEAGQAIKELYGKPHDVQFKGEIDLVTEADYKSEAILTSALEGLGGAELMAEESTHDLTKREGRFWIVDPLDGTTNFAHGFPFFAPSVAFAQIDEKGYETLFGAVYVPLLGEFFWAIKGKGAYLNLDEIGVSKERELSRSLLATGFPYDVHQHPDDVMAAMKSMIVRAQGIRRAGAAAIDLVYVACGRFEGFWEKKLKPWDTAAGILVVTEAGGKVSDYKGGTYNPFVPEIVASNGLIHEQMTDILGNFSCQPTNT
ncbi:MAG: inositol monophosphatase [Thermodesulfobacteria bacterium]|nr:inositol monophosphatase [Thermodesulfobacteriota bacterium]